MIASTLASAIDALLLNNVRNYFNGIPLRKLVLKTRNRNLQKKREVSKLLMFLFVVKSNNYPSMLDSI